MSVEHSEQCVEQQRVVAQWRKDWPKHCASCGASGGVTWYEDVVGDGGPRMQMGDYCEKCYGTCPRCGEALAVSEADEDELQAFCACGWAVDDEATHLPYDPLSDLCQCYDKVVSA